MLFRIVAYRRKHYRFNILPPHNFTNIDACMPASQCSMMLSKISYGGFQLTKTLNFFSICLCVKCA